MSGLLTRADIDGIDDRPVVDVPIEEWRGTVRLRAMGARDRELFFLVGAEEREKTPAERASFMVRLVAHCATDGTGARLWATPEDLAALGERHPAPVEKLFRAALALNGFVIDKESAEELEKN